MSKQRVVVFGAAGFVGAHIIKALDAERYEALTISRKDCDLMQEESRTAINALVRDGDIIVCAAAKAPAKNLDMLVENVALMGNIVEGIKGKKLSYILNVSSDAVYGDSMGKLSEASLMAPLSAHGIMHAMREHMLEKSIHASIGHIRPTLIYGQADPHNGYGPNSFVRLANAGQNITLFGEGEERRDHIFVGDVATIAASMIEQKYQGAVNAVSGKTISFMEIAALVQSVAKSKGKPIEIVSKPRSGPMPHNGWRAFDNANTRRACPDLHYKDIAAYIQEAVG